MKLSERQAAPMVALVILGCASSNDDSASSRSGSGGADQSSVTSSGEGGETARPKSADSRVPSSSGGAIGSSRTASTAAQLRGGGGGEPALSHDGGASNDSRYSSTSNSLPRTSASGGTQASENSRTSRANGGTSDPAATGGRAAAGGASNKTGEGNTPSSSGGSTTSSSGTQRPSDTSPGCSSGKTTSPCSKSGGTKCTTTSNSKTREYYLQLPTNYDPAKPYPVVVQLHGMIATADMALSWFKDIPKNMPEAIYITPQGLKHAEQGGGANGQEVTGWANVDGEDIQFMKDLISTAQKDYCVDTQRVFAVGFSYGGMMSYAIGCELGGVFRAIAPMSGAIISGCNLSGRPVAMWGAHGTKDSLVSISMGRQARDKILKQNHCGTETKPVEPSPCVAYQGCDEGYPVTWCEWDGDHNRPSFGNSAVAAFFKQF